MTLDTKAARAICEARGDCAGPLTTFPSPTLTHVSIVCGDNWAEVIQWLAACDKQFPAALDEIDRLNLIIADTATVLTAKVDAFEIENARLLRGARDAIDLAMSRMSPATYNKLLQLIDEATGIASDAIDSTSEAGVRLREIREKAGL